MSSRAQLGGIHPRSEQLVELTRSYDRGKVERTEVEKQIEQDTVDLIRLQEDSGFETISDGAFAWQDQLKPIVEKQISVKKLETKNFVRTDLLPKSKSWKVTLPGPYTFSQLAENLHYQSQTELLNDIAQAENRVIHALTKVGVSQFQITEPCLVYRPYRQDAPADREIDAGLAAIRKTVEGVNANFSVQTYFGDATTVLPELLKLPVNTIGIDLFETDYAQLNINTNKGLALGIIDSRESNV